MLRTFGFATLVGFLAGCGLYNGDARYRSNHALCEMGTLGLAIKSTGPVPEGCVKIEGADIGVAPQTLTAGGTTVTITGWTEKTDSPGEYVGFTYTTTGAGSAFAVKAATRTFVSDTSPWVHPDGTSGSAANGISNITFCEVPAPDGGTIDEGGGDEGTPGADAGGFPEGPGDTDGGSGGGGGECTPEEPVDAGVPGAPGSPCGTDADCAETLTCQQGVCVGVIN